MPDIGQNCKTSIQGVYEAGERLNRRMAIARISSRLARERRTNPDAVLLIREGKRNNKRTKRRYIVCCDYSDSWLFVFHGGVIGIEPVAA